MSDSPAVATPSVIQLSSSKFMAFCAAVAGLILWVGAKTPFSANAIAAEVFLTIIGLFLFGSFRYQIHKNALTYGMLLIISATFFTGWWPTSGLRAAVQAEGAPALMEFISHHFLSLHSLDNLIHTDTMLFILGLTFFVCVIAQTRLLESISFMILQNRQGFVLPTVALLTALVAAASGILDGVSMIGLMIRTLVIILFLAKADKEAVIFAVIISTVVTTVCGMWLAYGEPPNLIMKANLEPHLTNGFFLRYCLPVALGSYLIVFWNLRKRLHGRQINIAALDEVDRHMADARFFQASRFGEVFEPGDPRIHQIKKAELDAIRPERVKAQWIGALSFIPFVALLIAHAVHHGVALYWASFAGFAVALIGIFNHTKIRKLALHEAFHEYKEYLFLFPLFFSITLLQKSGFFSQLAALLASGIDKFGVNMVAFIQFTGATFLSALLDNNVVADFASRALHGLEISVLHLFAMAQIAGYAAGGCWTHIGSAQSVVAFSFIHKDVDEHYTPVQWIKAMTPVILQIFVLMVFVIYIEGSLLKYLH